MASQAKLKTGGGKPAIVDISPRGLRCVVGLGSRRSGFVGGPVGAATLAGSALLYFHQQAKKPRQSAIDLKDAVVKPVKLMRLSLNQLNVEAVRPEDKYENQETVKRNQLMKEIQDADSRIDSLKGFDPFGQLGG